MSSNLRVNSIIPSVGTNVAIGTASGSITFPANVSFSGISTIGISTAYIGSINDGPLSGTRNRIINGSMAVDQRNNGVLQTITAGAALAYTVDRWYAYCTGANVTAARAGEPTAQFSYQINGAASVTAIGFGQRIERLNTADLAGTTATLSVNLANTLLTTVTWTAFYANTADTFGTLASPTRTQIATGTFTVNSTVTRYSTSISVPAAATTGIEIVFAVGAQTSGTWTIGDVQLERGSVATPFERRSYGQELSLCQRYYEQITGDRYVVGSVYNAASGLVVTSEPYLVEKRAAPTVTLSGQARWFNAGTATLVNASSAGSPATTVKYVAYTVNLGSASTNYLAVIAFSTNVLISSEL